MPVNSSQGLGLSMAKASLGCPIMPSRVLPFGGRIKDFRCNGYSGTTDGKSGKKRAAKQGV